MKIAIAALASTFLLSACSPSGISEGWYGQHARIADISQTEKLLKQLPAPKRRPVVSVYDYKDLTGQHKPSDNIAEYSRAVTQGGSDILIKALLEAGNGKWFQVIERAGLENLLQERKIIRATRKDYLGDSGTTLPGLPPLLYAGLLIEGGIVAYESNTITGGIGGRYLGVGGNTEYRRDMVTVYIRATSVSNGEILLSTNATKTIYSTAAQGGVFKFIGVDKLLEVESGFSVNEPPQYAARQAIEMAVYSLVLEGAVKGLWEFNDKTAGQHVIAQYESFKHNKVDIDAVLKANAKHFGYDGKKKGKQKATKAPAITGYQKNRPQQRVTTPPQAPIPVIPFGVTPVPTQPAARGNIPHGNIPQPTLEQLPSSSRPLGRTNESSRRLPRTLVPTGYSGRREQSNGRYRNDTYCDNEGCYPVQPQ